MNAAFNHALRQSQQIRKDLELLAANPTSLGQQGQISATLSSFTRTIEEYQVLLNKELIVEKREKANERIKNFRIELKEFKLQLTNLKNDRDQLINRQNENNRHELLGRRVNARTDDNLENPYNNNNNNNNEAGFINQTSNQLDEFLETGRTVLNDIIQQKQIIKSTQMKIYSTANTLGISNETIHYIERRAYQDKWGFIIGVILTLVAFYYIIRYFG